MVKKGAFLDFIRSSGRRWQIIVPIFVGVVILLISSAAFNPHEDNEAEEIEKICSTVEGVGKCSVMLAYAPDGETVVAVAVICDGGDSITVRHRLTELLSSFYGIGYHRISIEKSA